jgi:membrane-bound lytic murein transglycosylase B
MKLRHLLTIVSRRAWFGAVIAMAALLTPSYAALAKEVPPPPPFGEWLNELRTEALRRGIHETTLTRALSGVQPIERVIELDRRQPEFTLTLSSYFKKAISDERIAKGRAMLKEHAALLKRIEEKFGVQARFLVAFWGLESNFGQFTGSFSAVGALVTLAHDRRRAGFFREQLLSLLELIDAGDIPSDVKASWAGAMGNHQFIPTTYKGYAIDFDGDGKRDLWGSLPDIFASAANYLSRSGWQRDKTWGREVLLPQGFDIALTGMDIRKPLKEWNEFGIRRVDGKPLPNIDIEASVMLPAGYKGPAFLVYKNYRTIMVWNRSHLYALAVGHLADRLAGQGALATPPLDQDAPLSRADIRELQALLNGRGFDAGPADGMLGSKTRAAVRAYQQSAGIPPDGYATKPLIERLRAQN